MRAHDRSKAPGAGTEYGATGVPRGTRPVTDSSTERAEDPAGAAPYPGSERTRGVTDTAP